MDGRANCQAVLNNDIMHYLSVYLWGTGTSIKSNAVNSLGGEKADIFISYIM